MATWEEATLLIVSQSRSMTLQNLYRKIPDHIELTELHRTITYGQPTFTHEVRSIISNLCKNGEVKNVGRGIYAVTDLPPVHVPT